MANGSGLKGHMSSSNAAIVIPRPGSATIFYIFTSGAAENNNEGYYFSEVDISMQGGLGAVTANKNIFLYGHSTEKLTAARHSNGVDVWVITKQLGNTIWNVFKVDCNGVHTTPVASSAGYLADPQSVDVNVGYLKASPDGTKIASVNTVDGVWELLQFDASTGIVSNGITFSEGMWPFGAEFSPDSRLLYIGIEQLPTAQEGAVYQYNVTVHDSAAIIATETLVSNTDQYVGGLQLGPDNKIYCALDFATSLSVINSPNTPGIACNFVDKQIDLKGKGVFRGLPVFFPGLITHKNADFSYTVHSDCATVHFSASTLMTGNVSWQWDFGDGTTGTGQNITHTYTAGRSSTDTVTLTVASTTSCGVATAVKKVIVEPSAQPVARFDHIIQCGSTTVAFADSSVAGTKPIQSWYWNFGDGSIVTQQHPSHSYASPGNYMVQLSAQSTNGCSSDTISRQILVEAVPAVSFTHTAACIGEQIEFTNTTSLSFGTITGYTWSFGDGSASSLVDPVHRYNDTGDFTTTLKVFTTNGCTTTASKIFHMAPVHAFAGNDTTVAIGQPLQLHATGGAHYQWSPPDFLNTDTIFNPVAMPDRDQHYHVHITTAEGCVGDDDLFIRVFKGPDIYVPNAFTPGGRNTIFRPVLAGIEELYYFSVYNRWGQQVFTTREAGKGWDGRINGTTQPQGMYVWALKAKDYKGNVIARKGTVLLIR